MSATRHKFLTPPVAGETYIIDGQSYRVLSSEPYTRRQTGESSALFRWETDCPSCHKAVSFLTGPTAGDIVSFCRGCWWPMVKDRNRRFRAKVAAERVCDNPANPIIVYRALQAAQGDDPVQMSVARNAPRRIFAPLILRDLYEPLADHTIAEILAGIDCAILLGLITWSTVARYKGGAKISGLVARPEEFLRENGWWPEKAASVFD